MPCGHEEACRRSGGSLRLLVQIKVLAAGVCSGARQSIDIAAFFFSGTARIPLLTTFTFPTAIVIPPSFTLIRLHLMPAPAPTLVVASFTSTSNYLRLASGAMTRESSRSMPPPELPPYRLPSPHDKFPPHPLPCCHCHRRPGHYRLINIVPAIVLPSHHIKGNVGWLFASVEFSVEELVRGHSCCHQYCSCCHRS